MSSNNDMSRPMSKEDNDLYLWQTVVKETVSLCHQFTMSKMFESRCEVRNGVRTILIGRNYMVDGEGLAIGRSTVTWFFTMTF